MNTDLKFVWTQDYSVGVGVLDEQHQQFFGIINEIYDFLDRKPGDKEELLIIITKLGNYALYHLSSEEEYFKDLSYPEGNEHTRWHNAFRETIGKYLERIKDPAADADAMAIEIADFAKDWLAHHILEADKRYSSWFNSHGLK